MSQSANSQSQRQSSSKDHAMDKGGAYTLPEKLTMANANKVLDELLRFETHSSVTVDMHPLTHCDSAGIAVLVAAKAAFAKQKQSIHFAAPNEQVVSLAQFLKVDALLFSNG